MFKSFRKLWIADIVDHFSELYQLTVLISEGPSGEIKLQDE